MALTTIKTGGLADNSVTDAKVADAITVTGAQTGITQVGTLTSFRSTGIDDNADATAITIDSSERVGIGITSSITDPLHVKTTAVETRISLESSTGKWAIGAEDNDKFGILNYGTSTPFIIDSSGKVGIGTASPATVLHLRGEGGTALTSSFLTMEDTTANNGDYLGTLYATRPVSNNAGKTFIGVVRTGSYGRNDIVFACDNSADDSPVASGDEVMRIASAGNVGIGTSTPSGGLQISTGHGGSTGSLRIDGTDNNIHFMNGTNEDNYIRSGKSSGNVILQDTGGNVGIGTASPSVDLVVSNGGANGIEIDARASASFIGSFNRSTSSYTNLSLETAQLTFAPQGSNPVVVENTTEAIFRVKKDADYTELAQNNSGGVLTFQKADGSTGAQILSYGNSFFNGGNVGIGDDAPSYRLDVKANVDSWAQRITNTHGNAYGLFINRNAGAGSANTDRKYLQCEDNSAVRLIIYSNGNVVNANDSYGSTSDKRIKNSIADASSQWDDIKALKIRKFKKNEAGENAPYHIGVIAQELETSGMNGLIDESPAMEDQIRNNEEISEGDSVKSVKTSVLYMKALKALQEAMAKIETLESKVTALENA